MAFSSTNALFSSFFSSSIAKSKGGKFMCSMSIPISQIARNQTLDSSPNLVFTTDEIGIRHAQKLKEARNLFTKIAAADSLESLEMIDSLQRLGIDYLFRDGIESVLEKQSELYQSFRNNDLWEISLRFRLLRQEGYWMPADVFNNFKDVEGKFNQELARDLKGLMGLYEASQLVTDREDILDEAGEFSCNLLKSSVEDLDEQRAKTVVHALNHPHHRSLPRFMVKNFLQNPPWPRRAEYRGTFLELAKMDFNVVQSLHQEEIVQISKWWKELGLSKELEFARNQPIEWYIWPMAGLTDPKYSDMRIEIAKPISLVYIIDDIFDLCGNLHDLTLFTNAINRWDVSEAEQLPDYMKIGFMAVYNVTNEFANKVFIKHGFHPLNELRKSWARLFNAFLEEAKWFSVGKLPKPDEYMEIATTSSGVHLALAHVFFMLGDGITEENISIVNDFGGLLLSIATLLRLWDDLDIDNKDGFDGSYMKCYMQEHPGMSTEQARDHVVQEISKTWKKLNRECLHPNPFPANFVKAAVNAARLVPVMYACEFVNHRSPSLKDTIKSVLFENVSI